MAEIELVNEPMGPAVDMNVLKQFYMDGWGNLMDSHVAITFHDAFKGVTSWNDWGAGMWALLLDTHHYQIFDSGSLQMSLQQHVGTACAFGSQMASNNKWTISGEWTGAITDCAKWLNGLGKGARYDGTFPGSSWIGSCDGKNTGTVAGLSAADKYNIQHFIEAQLDGFEKAQGWIFWTWKTESAPEWHMKDLLAAGLFPNPVTSRNRKSRRARLPPRDALLTLAYSARPVLSILAIITPTQHSSRHRSLALPVGCARLRLTKSRPITCDTHVRLPRHRPWIA